MGQLLNNINMIYLPPPLSGNTTKDSKMADTYRSEDHFHNSSFLPHSTWREFLFINHNVGTRPRDGVVDSQVTVFIKSQNNKKEGRSDITGKRKILVLCKAN